MMISILISIKINVHAIFDVCLLKYIVIDIATKKVCIKKNEFIKIYDRVYVVVVD